MIAQATQRPLRTLAIVGKFKYQHVDYLAALSRHVELWTLWSGVGHEGAPELGLSQGLRARDIGKVSWERERSVRRNLAAAIIEVRPELIHMMYYRHERLTVLAREIAGPSVPIVWESRDPSTTLENAQPGSGPWKLEAQALKTADGHILVSEALRRYLQASHGTNLADALIVPHAFAARTAGPPSEKLSSVDGRTHIALVGTVDAAPGFGRYYVDIIRRLVRSGFVVHSHFHDQGSNLGAYRALAEELADYHLHPTVSFLEGHLLSDLTSRYDLMGVFHELEAPQHNESSTLAVCMPTKAVSAWLHGGIPIVTFPHYAGLVEHVQEKGIGFVARDWEDVGTLVGDWDRIRAATQASLAHREEFTHEYQAPRIVDHYRRVISRKSQVLEARAV